MMLLGALSSIVKPVRYKLAVYCDPALMLLLLLLLYLFAGSVVAVLALVSRSHTVKQLVPCINGSQHAVGCSMSSGQPAAGDEARLLRALSLQLQSHAIIAVECLTKQGGLQLLTYGN